MQREKHSIPFEKRGLLQCDGFKANFSTTNGEDLRRAKWSESANMELPTEEKGGWSGKGQACDKAHKQFRQKLDKHGDMNLELCDMLFTTPANGFLQLATEVACRVCV